MAEGDSEPIAKRQKMDLEEPEVEIDKIVYDFLKDEQAVSTLKYALPFFEQGYEGFVFMFYKFIDIDARASRSFSKVSIETELYKNSNNDRERIAAGAIFVEGIEVLKKYLEKKIPEDKTQLTALTKLLHYLFSKKDHQILMEERNKAGEGNWAITIAQHLLVKLAVDNTYTVDSSSGVTFNTKFCPCKEKEKMVGTVGNTTYGCAKLWHGSTDIIMEEVVPVAVARGGPDEDEDEEEYENEDRIEIKSKTKHFSESQKAQLIAETIVFSFFQKNKGKLKHSLVPGIGISSEKLRIYFYDAVHDLLIGSLPLSLFHINNTVASRAVILLWLTLNYRLFCSGSTDEMKRYKSAFRELVLDRIDWYEDKTMLTRPCNVPNKSKDDDSMEFEDEPLKLNDLSEAESVFLNLPPQK